MLINWNSEVGKSLLALKKYFSYAVLFTIIANVLSLAPIGYMKDVYGPVLNSKDQMTLFYVTLLLVGVLIIGAFLEWIRAVILSTASIELGRQFSPRVFQATFKINFERQASGSNQMALKNLKTIRNFIASPAMGLLLDAPMSLFFLLLVIDLNPILGAVSVLSGLAMFLVASLNEKKIRPIVTASQKMSSRSMLYLEGSVRNAQVISAMGMSENIFRKWFQIHEESGEGQAIAAELQVESSAVSKLIMMAQGSVVLGLGCWLSIEGYIAYGDSSMIIASILGGRAIQPMMQLISSWKNVILARDAIKDLDTFLEKVPQEKEAMSLPAPQGKLAVENILVYAPGTKNIVIRDMTFSVPQGKMLTVIGESGSGKSCLLRALIGIWKVTAGNVRLDDVDIYSWNKNELGQYMGYLPQEVDLFDGTIADNIARFKTPDASKLQQAIELTDLNDILAGLPDGLNTQIGDEGLILSGGQRQRLALARAIYGMPKFLVLDEPDSSLDKLGEAALIKALIALRKQGSTIVIVTHHKKMLGITDYILYMHEGKPKIFGPRGKVIEKMQSKSAEPETSSD